MSKNEIIHDYGYKPEPIFYGDDDMYMGVELEVDFGGESSSNAEDLLCIANFPNERMYIKHDGSIEDGFETVTHLISLDYRNIPNRREQAICRKIQVLRCHLEYQEDIPDSKVPLC